MHRVRNSLWNPILKIQIWEWERELYFREENDWWNLIYKPMLGILPLLDITLSIRVFFFSLSFFLSIVFAVCVLTLFFYICLLFSFSFFSFVCTPSIYREIPKKLFPYFSLNWSDHGAVFVNFSSTAPNFLLSRDPFFSFFSLLFVSYLFKLPLFSLWHPHFSTFQVHFHQTVFLTFWWCHFIIHFSAFVFVLLDLCRSFAFVLGSRLWTWLIFYIYIYIYIL